MTKIYFACSITGGGDNSNYLSLIQTIKTAGGDVISEIFANDAINYGGSPLPAEDIYLRDIEMIHEADAVIAELSNPSLGVGYELGYAEKIGKPILGLYNRDAEKRLSAMVTGNSYVDLAYYTVDGLPVDEINTFIKQTVPEIKEARLEIGGSGITYLSPSASEAFEKALSDETPRPNPRLRAAIRRARGISDFEDLPAKLSQDDS